MQQSEAMYDVAVVGQGIAGSLLSWFLKQAGMKVLVIDESHMGSSSALAAGIVNPVTGKSFVPSWNIGLFLPFALKTYREMESNLGISLVKEVNIIRSLYSIQDENTWFARSDDPVVGMYIRDRADLSEFEGKVRPPYSYGETQGTFQVDLALLMENLKIKWLSSGNYLESKFDHNSIEFRDEGFYYQGIKFRKVVFCEGYRAKENKFFPGLGMGPSKGEVLLVKIPGANFRKMYKDQIFIVHQYNDIYWVGSGYQWNAPDDLPTPAIRQKLESQLSAILTIPYEVVGHKAAIRPTMHTRRPIFSEHSEYKGMYLFNGLGTKGTSIGPLAAFQISDYLAGVSDFPPLFAALTRIHG